MEKKITDLKDGTRTMSVNQTGEELNKTRKGKAQTNEVANDDRTEGLHSEEGDKR